MIFIFNLKLQITLLWIQWKICCVFSNLLSNLHFIRLKILEICPQEDGSMVGIYLKDLLKWHFIGNDLINSNDLILVQKLLPKID